MCLWTGCLAIMASHLINGTPVVRWYLTDCGSNWKESRLKPCMVMMNTGQKGSGLSAIVAAASQGQGCHNGDNYLVGHCETRLVWYFCRKGWITQGLRPAYQSRNDRIITTNDLMLGHLFLTSVYKKWKPPPTDN